jgi:hypothetical protein
MGMEAGSMGPAWPERDLDDLRKGAILISDENAALLRSMGPPRVEPAKTAANPRLCEITLWGHFRNWGQECRHWQTIYAEEDFLYVWRRRA